MQRDGYRLVLSDAWHDVEITPDEGDCDLCLDFKSIVHISFGSFGLDMCEKCCGQIKQLFEDGKGC